MSLSSLDTATTATSPPSPSVDDYLEAERAAIVRERLAVDLEARTKRWTMIRSAGLGLALAGTIAFGWNHLHADAADADRTPVTADQEGRPAG